jgi:predicted nuclease of predicted toxin-antitoxin system
VAASEDHGGRSDRDIFEIVRREGRVLLTFDKDFGDLYRESPLVAPSGLILFRFRRPTSPDARRRILDVLTSDFVWSGKFCVVEPDRVRVHSPRE